MEFLHFSSATLFCPSIWLPQMYFEVGAGRSSLREPDTGTRERPTPSYLSFQLLSSCYLNARQAQKPLINTKESLADCLEISTRLLLVTGAHQEGHSLQTEPYPFVQRNSGYVEHCILSAQGILNCRNTICMLLSHVLSYHSKTFKPH